MSNYLLELSIIHVSLIAGYWFFLKNESQYGKMRFYLVASTLLSLTIPFLKLPRIIGNWVSPTTDTTLQSIPLEALTLTTQTQDTGTNWNFLWYAYALISAFYLFKLVSSLRYLIKLKRSSKKLNVDGIQVHQSDQIDGSFTFFNWIFIGPQVQENKNEYDAILKHETAHARLGHTYDLLFFQLYRLVFWWLPSAWFINKEIKKIHEYQADAYVLKSYNQDLYSSILISSTLKSNGLSLASSFHDGLILKRLKAMKQNVKQVSPWKFGALLSLLAVLFVVFACSEELDQDLKEMGQMNNAISFDQLPSGMQKRLADVQDQLVFTKLTLEGNEDIDMKRAIANAESLQDIDPSTIHTMDVDNEAGVVYIAIKKDGANFNYLAEKSKMDGEVFTLVEEQPEYPGGMDAFYNYVGSVMTYPLQARKAGVQGRVYVQFIVEKDGSVSDVKAIKGIGAGCDAEAVRVISGLDKWTPGSQRGKPVRVRMVMPIIFKLDNTPQDGEEQNVIIIEEVESNNQQLKVGANYDQGIWSGTIYDSESGEPLAGAAIVEEGTNHGTVSDLKGNFKLKLSDESNDLVVSFMGYQSSRITQSN